jgi:RNA polymerase sigma factor (sigma-70 family)
MTTALASPTLEQLYKAYFTRIYRRAYTLMGNRQDAEDLTQEAFLKAWRALPRLHSTDNLYGWLYRIVTNTAYDALKRRKQRGACQSLDETCDTLPAPDGDLQERYERKECLRAAWGRLTPSHQLAVDQGKSTEAMWLNVTCWEKLAEIVERYAQKGSLVFVQGRLQLHKPYTGKDGIQRQSLDVVASTVQLLEKRQDTDTEVQATATDRDPFLPDDFENEGKDPGERP